MYFQIGNERTQLGTWDASAAEREGFEVDNLYAFLEEIDRGVNGAITSVLISRHGNVVLERYYGGFERDRMHRLFSVTKSVASALVGIALDQGRIESLDQKVMDFMPGYRDQPWLDPRLRDLTIRHVLAMEVGFTWDEFADTFVWNEATPEFGTSPHDANKMMSSDDWYRYALTLPLEGRPGDVVCYSTGTSMLLSEVLRQATGQSPDAFAAEYLFGPLGIRQWKWVIGPKGLVNTAQGLALRPADLLKFGHLYLNRGRVGDRQVVSEAWVATSTQRRVTINRHFDFAYHWWRFPVDGLITRAAGVDDIFFGWGHAGQFLFVIPHSETVIVITSANYRSRSNFNFLTFKNRILKSIK